MTDNYVLTSGQINFQSNNNKNAYSCVVIKNGVFYNMTDEHRELIIRALDKKEINLDDMF